MTDEWLNAPDEEFMKKFTGFIYIITNNISGKYYIGQKKFWFKQKLKPLKGKKQFRHKIKESDWKDYYGSCKKLLDDIEKLGKENFTREITQLASSKAWMNYYETEEQFKRKVLLDPQSYNKIINCRIHARTLR